MNRKKIVMGLLFIILIAIAVWFIFFFQKSGSVTLTSADSSFQIHVPNKVSYKVKEPTGADDKLDFYSVKDEMFFTSSVYPITGEINLAEVVEKEKTNLPNMEQDVKDVSDVQAVVLKDYTAFQYHYTYYDPEYKNNFYTQVVWIQTEKNVYILDLQVITKNAKPYSSIFNAIVQSFVEISNAV